jgi:hypothetical protein
MFYTALDAGKKHAFEPPVWEKQQIFIFRSGTGKQVSEEIFLKQIGLNSTKLTVKQAVCLFQDSRRTALWTLMLDK